MTRHLNLPPGRPLRGPGIGGALRRWGETARRLIVAAAVGVVLLAGNRSAFAEEDMPLDYQVKAAFLVNFPKYVDWPTATFADTNTPIVVAIFGDDNVAGEFSNMIEGGRIVGGHPVVLKHISKEDEIGADCQIVFVASSERDRVPAILEKVKGTGILTVGESPDFLEKGGIINLVHRDRKIRLQVNLSAAGKAHLKISSRLLVVADVVKGKAD